METITGEVVTTYGEGETFKFKIGEVYYSNKFKTPPEIRKGDVVTVGFQNNPNFKNQFWKTVAIAAPGAVVSAAPAATGAAPVRSTFVGFPVPYTSDKRAIIRQNALTNAVQFCIKFVPKADTAVVIGTAMDFEKYTSGDLDEEAKKEMEAELNATAT